MKFLSLLVVGTFAALVNASATPLQERKCVERKSDRKIEREPRLTSEFSQ